MFEDQWVDVAQRKLGSAFNISPGPFVSRIGNIDLIARINRYRIPIEIKSFRHWDTHLFIDGEREKRAIRQAKMQVQYLNAPCGIIWLPETKPTFLQSLFGVQRDNVRVVFGDTDALRKALKNLGRSIQ